MSLIVIPTPGLKRALTGKYGYSTYLHYNILCNEMTRDNYSSKNDYGFIDIQNERCSSFPKYNIDKYNKIDFKKSNFKTIIVYGDADTSTTPAFAQNLSKQFPESNKLVLSLENLAHAPFSFSVDYSEFYEDKFYEGEKCRNEILDSFFKGFDTWPDVSCASKLYPPIYSSEKGLTSFEKLINEFVLYI
ncbi:hypothetical protein [Fluviispira sanaruensis]|uniref:Uncharacterized protein n=1 Tax=Fluviispira sanaruensis TaxID=2493639 RepID=A0A4P2VMM0_FLUSA|nr:hypothetical protein [Fluviispira sanaruensis]BBH54656.1 hypothetical protein JCM31447_31300 [Fluviispira sanaruensis]